MTLKQLIYFQMLSRELNYTKTARQLFISQPSLSYTIRELEAELGTSLFTRIGSSKKICLTKAGEIFLEYVEAALTSLNNGRDAVSSYISTESLMLRIGYIHTFPLAAIKKLLKDYQHEYPNNTSPARGDSSKGHDYTLYREIFTSNTALHEAIASGKLNFALSLSMTDKVDGFVLMQQELYVFVSKNHPLGSRTHISFDELRREPCIRVPHAVETNLCLDTVYHAYSYEPVVSFQAENTNAAIAYVMDYNCYTVAPKVSTMDLSQLTALQIDGHPLSRPIYFIWKKGKHFNTLEGSFHDFVYSRCRST